MRKSIIEPYRRLSENVLDGCLDLYGLVTQLVDSVDRLPQAEPCEIASWLEILAAFFDHRLNVVYNGDYLNSVLRAIENLETAKFPRKICNKWLSSLLLLRWFMKGGSEAINKSISCNNDPPDDDPPCQSENNGVFFEELLGLSRRTKKLIAKLGSDLDHLYIQFEIDRRSPSELKSAITEQEINSVYESCLDKGVLKVGEDMKNVEKMIGTELYGLLQKYPNV